MAGILIRLCQALISITTQAETPTLFLLLGIEAVPRKFPGVPLATDTQEMNTRVTPGWTVRRSLVRNVYKEPMQYGTGRGGRSLHPSRSSASSFRDESQNSEFQMRKQLKEMLLSSNVI